MATSPGRLGARSIAGTDLLRLIQRDHDCIARVVHDLAYIKRPDEIICVNFDSRNESQLNQTSRLSPSLRSVAPNGG
jgi:hypothetical protein